MWNLCFVCGRSFFYSYPVKLTNGCQPLGPISDRYFGCEKESVGGEHLPWEKRGGSEPKGDDEETTK